MTIQWTLEHHFINPNCHTQNLDRTALRTNTISSTANEYHRLPHRRGTASHLPLEPDVPPLPFRHRLPRNISSTLGHHHHLRRMTITRSTGAVRLRFPAFQYLPPSRIRRRGDRRLTSSSWHALVGFWQRAVAAACHLATRSFARITSHHTFGVGVRRSACTCCRRNFGAPRRQTTRGIVTCVTFFWSGTPSRLSTIRAQSRGLRLPLCPLTRWLWFSPSLLQ